MPRSGFAFKPLLLLYPLVIILLSGLFIGFQYMANQVPQGFVAQKLGNDFRNYNLSTNNYPFSAYGSHSILSNTGQNQYTECAVLLSVLSEGGKGLRNAVLPRTMVRTNNRACALLKKTVAAIEKGEALQTRALRTRYWWGARPVYSLMLRYFTVYETRELIRNATALAYMGLAIALFAISARMFWLSAPLLLFGTMFSGASYYSEVILGVPYLWAVFAATLLAALHAARLRLSLIHVALFGMGMISSYIWLLDGHLILLFAWVMLIGFFASARSMDSLVALRVMFKHLFAFGSGFVAAAISGQVVKAMYLGMASIWEPLVTAIAFRSSSVGPDNAELSLAIVFQKVWGVGYWWTGLFRNELLWPVVLWSSVIAGGLGLGIGLLRGLQGNRRMLFAMLVCVLIVLSVFLRLLLLQNHSAIHAFFIGRYMFIPLAMAWVMLLLALFGVPSSDAGQDKSRT